VEKGEFMATFPWKYPANKWRKQQVLERQAQLRAHLPETRLYSEEHLAALLAVHRTVFLKPKVGGGGKGIVRITTYHQGAARRYQIQTALSTRKLTNFEQLIRAIRSHPLNNYIVQQGIDLIQLNQRPIDFRVLLGRIDDQWQLFGTMGKLAAKGKHVTNYSRGGEPIQLQPALLKTLQQSPKQIDQLAKKINTISLNVAKTLNLAYPQLNQLGIDIAIDTAKKIYILEANSRPNYELFRAHEDPQLYAKIARWIEAERLSDML
jgi:glutathione synthase/RimK-type ligase-like ATP-grasp enzyme